jgi:hypothetical protein
VTPRGRLAASPDTVRRRPGVAGYPDFVRKKGVGNIFCYRLIECLS